MSEEELADIVNFEHSQRFTPVEKCVMAYARAMTKTPVDVPQELFEELSGHYDAPQLVELTAVISWENYRARFDHAFEIGP